MKQVFAKFSKIDWITFISCCILVILTLIPIFWDVSTASGWLRTALISLGALSLSTVVLAQISARDSSKKLIGEVEGLQMLVESAIDRNAVHEVPSGHIGNVLKEMLATSNEWYFRGGSATWQRKAVLPRLANVTNRPVRYLVQIISPFEDELCREFANYRHKSRPDDNSTDLGQIQLELFAYLYAIVMWSSRSKIQAKVTLLHRFSPFRLDGNSESFMITVADLKRNGLRTNEGNWYHSSILDEFEFEFDSAKELFLPKNTKYENNSDGVKTFLRDLKELNPSMTDNWDNNYDNSDLESIVQMAGVDRA